MSRQGQNSSQFRSSKFEVYMFEEDYEIVIKGTVMKHLDVETGGNLFGLWTSEGRDLKPMIHIVLGPGQGCKRTEYSFFQDVSYLQRVGSSLANDYMLGHIGEWHSHHQLTLREPSPGDCSTVRRNYPSGNHGFLLIIANILPNDEVTLSPFLFREKGDVQVGNVVLIAGRSPFWADGRIEAKVNEGAERHISLISRVSTQIVEKVTSIKQMIVGKPDSTSRNDTTEQSSSTAPETTKPNNSSVIDQENAEKGIDNKALSVESANSTRDGEGATSSDSGDVQMKRDFWYRSDDRDTMLGKMFDGIKGITHTSQEPFSVSFTFSGGMDKETATKVLSMLQEVTGGDEKIKLSFDFSQNSNHWTVELPADHPRSPVTLRCVNQDADGQAKEDIQKDNMQEIIDKIQSSVLSKNRKLYA